ncbi:uncharacterized protein J3R85_020972 [Psidium guajava]|nr:uncharacterized protein J3R85_020972 [Psidium guajava]
MLETATGSLSHHTMAPPPSFPALPPSAHNPYIHLGSEFDRFDSICERNAEFVCIPTPLVFMLLSCSTFSRSDQLHLMF